jgi:hypothetical protein
LEVTTCASLWRQARLATKAELQDATSAKRQGLTVPRIKPNTRAQLQGALAVKTEEVQLCALTILEDEDKDQNERHDADDKARLCGYAHLCHTHRLRYRRHDEWKLT